ncbi:NACHT domain-containing protein [Rhizobium leguminosarum]|uniref:NACHT domain-containing protein n=1 Tax=Rhizobium leguminosarum TaxID=384 RepID=UPI00144152A9|nr:NACHT domain-containing protein [Rhizobium leguminosarum]MBY5868788.1 hypothetical protein [Rhizobium leguminosarum]NKM06216.1 hypothetical protein [Rhizobium leguminosarum bv. viciae]
MKRTWASFEDRVREIAGHIWGRPCVPARVGGVAVDGVCILESELHCFVEITVERNLGKVREDVIKLQVAKAAAYREGVHARCFCIVNGPVTSAMKEAGEPHHIRVMSVDDFTKQFFDFPAYEVARAKAPFGSSINPITGEADDTKYVPVRYTVDGRKNDISSKDVADFLREGRNVILLGEYGSGKSRCIREVFRQLATSAVEEFCHPLAIDLRRSWGLKESGELIRRHFTDLGLDGLQASAIKAFRAGSLALLLDGFDEIGSQAWSNDNSKLRVIRAKSLEGVRDIVVSNSGGTLVAGREHYFPSSEEMFSALGMSPKETVVIRSKNEFSDSELLEYFQNRDIDVDVPTWLPRRPLICQTIGELAKDQFETMFGEEGDEIAFWNHFIDVLCQRDANINISFDRETIRRIFVNLARLTRTKSANVGPISLSELQTAFELATGAAPVEDASVMLQRLPSLGRIGPESNDRQFVDMYILDGLRAQDVASISLLGDEAIADATKANWANPLDDLGQRILASEDRISEKSKLTLAAKAAKAGNSVMASDLVASLLREKTEGIDFEGLTVDNGIFILLPLDERQISNLIIKGSSIGELALPVKSARNVQISDCVAERVTGVSSQAALPEWIQRLDAGELDSVASVSRIRKIGLKPAQAILITIIRKTFFQKGAGRKEEALLRGLGKVATRSLSRTILNIMIRENLLTTFRGDEGTVYSPVRSHTNRMQKLLDELAASADPLWADVSKL